MIYFCPQIVFPSKVILRYKIKEETTFEGKASDDGLRSVSEDDDKVEGEKMRKIVCSIVVLLLVFSLALYTSAETNNDYSIFSDEDLRQMIKNARIELSTREARENAEYITVMDNNGVQVLFLGTFGFESPYSRDKVFLDYIIINNSDIEVFFTLNDTTLNGWSQISTTGFRSVAPKTKIKNAIGFYLNDAGISELDELEDLQFVLNCVNSSTWENVYSAPVSFEFQKMSKR